MSKQRGMGIVSIFFLLVLLIGGAIVVMKCVPTYLEYFAIKRTFSVLKVEAKGASARQIKEKFSARAQIDDIKSITADDLEISQEGGETVVSASYQVVIPMFSNISLLFDFNASTQN